MPGLGSCVFKMSEIRGDSLASHAAARAAKGNDPAIFAARAAGQAVATAHVPQHAFGGAYCALKTIAAIDSVHAEAKVAKEHAWQVKHNPANLRQEVLKRVIFQKRGNRIFISIVKDQDY